MSPQEHLLMLTLFTKQLQQIKVIVNVLKSRAILQADDAQAFESATILDHESNAAIFAEAKAAYVKLAKGL
jgi:hypothetical protein